MKTILYSNDDRVTLHFSNRKEYERFYNFSCAIVLEMDDAPIDCIKSDDEKQSLDIDKGIFYKYLSSFLDFQDQKR